MLKNAKVMGMDTNVVTQTPRETECPQLCFARLFLELFLAQPGLIEPLYFL